MYSIMLVLWGDKELGGFYVYSVINMCIPLYIITIMHGIHNSYYKDKTRSLICPRK